MAASRLLGGRRCRLQYAYEIGIGTKIGLCLSAHVVEQAAQIAGDVCPQTPEIDVGLLQHAGGFAVFRQREQKVL